MPFTRSGSSLSASFSRATALEVRLVRGDGRLVRRDLLAEEAANLDQAQVRRLVATDLERLNPRIVLVAAQHAPGRLPQLDPLSDAVLRARAPSG
jgi:hypothetical protein